MATVGPHRQQWLLWPSTGAVLFSRNFNKTVPPRYRARLARRLCARCRQACAERKPRETINGRVEEEREKAGEKKKNVSRNEQKLGNSVQRYTAISNLFYIGPCTLCERNAVVVLKQSFFRTRRCRLIAEKVNSIEIWQMSIASVNVYKQLLEYLTWGGIVYVHHRLLLLRCDRRTEQSENKNLVRESRCGWPANERKK